MSRIATSPASRAAEGHWSEIAQIWDLSGPPLRVSPEDARAYWDAVADVVRRRAAPRVLILGVTPEIYALPWPEGTDVAAADRSLAMIAKVWPGPRQAVRHEEWTALSFADGSREVVFCDGGFHLLSHPEGQAELARSLRRIVAPDGLVVLRLFVPPREPETADQVLRDLREGRVANVNVLRLRLAMALQRDPRAGVPLADVWRVFEEAEPDPEGLAARIGWPAAEVCSMDSYRDSEARYHYVPVDDVVRLFCRDPGGFRLESVRVPGYELAERCPMVALRRTGE